ncbi:unnamed protein product, partial [Meganyctiphanes norvegica]
MDIVFLVLLRPIGRIEISSKLPKNDQIDKSDPTCMSTGFHMRSNIMPCVNKLLGLLFGSAKCLWFNSPLVQLKEEFALSTIWHEAIVSATILTAWLFALVAGPCSDRFGRKAVILMASLVFAVGAILMGAAPEKITLLIGRLIVGIGIGLASMSVPMYLSEVAPADFRGRLVVVNNAFITGGQFIASLLCGALSTTNNGWRWMMGLAGVPAAIQLAGFLYLPESPRWLVANGKINEARAVLEKVRNPSDNKEEELSSIVEAVANSEEQSGIGEVIRSVTVRRALIIGCLLQLFQQISGINTVMYYSASIITMAGVTDKSLAIWLSAVTSSINFFCTFIGMWLVDKVGRRILTIGSLLGSTAALFALALSFHLAYLNSPVLSDDQDPGTCAAHTCGICTSKSACGFCFAGDMKNITEASCVLANHSSYNEMSKDGLCSNQTLIEEGEVTFAYDWCPYQYGWFSILGLGLYLFAFAPGMGPMPWTINSEIYPGWARATCTSIATSVNWASNLLVSLTFLTLTEVLLKHGAFYLYMGLAGLGTLVFYLILPETKGVPLENIEEVFSHPLGSKASRSEWKPKTRSF